MGVPEKEIRAQKRIFSLEYPAQYLDRRSEIIEKTRQKRAEYRGVLANHLQQICGHDALQASDLRCLDGANFLLSGSRGGSSITIDILKQQAKGARGTGGKIFSLPGEQRPYFELAKLTPPFKGFLSDRLDRSHANSEKGRFFLTELASEIGYPIEQTSDLRGFAITIYGRLLLQWPAIDFGPTDETINKIEKAVSQVCSKHNGVLTYVDQTSSRYKLMSNIKLCFPAIDLRFYDDINSLPNTSSSPDLSQYDCFIEEPPFILPSPWHFVSRDELSQGVLMFKDPSDAWRIPFWKYLLREIPLSWIHLTRNAYESINGLCDGWKFPYGYLTTRSPRPLQVKGYATREVPWTQWYANYSTSDKVWELLLNGQPVDLELVAAQQWIDAHQTIINQVGGDSRYLRLVDNENPQKVGFEWLRSEPVRAVTQVCNVFGFELTSSLLEAAEKITIRRIQITPGTDGRSNRWRQASNHDLIAAYVRDRTIAKLSETLGYSTE